MENVELISLLTGQPAAVALAILAMYWLNKNTLDFAREKREWLELIRAERKEWQEEARQERAELIDLHRTTIESNAQVRHELHALRNQLAPIVTGINFLAAKFGGDSSRTTQTGD